MKRVSVFCGAVAALVGLSLGLAIPATAQTPNPLQPRGGASATAPAAPSLVATTRAAKPKAAASGDFKARRAQCSQQWKAAKATRTTGDDKWPQFFSKCNTRLKAQGV
jgi:hypothetical protein